MISREEILNLAQLARLTLSDGEVERLQKDISSILDYVGQVSSAPLSDTTGKPLLRNVMRDDIPGQVLGKRDALLAAFPKQEGDYNVVRKIIQKDE